jgi:hypothetical protein
MQQADQQRQKRWDVVKVGVKSTPGQVDELKGRYSVLLVKSKGQTTFSLASSNSDVFRSTSLSNFKLCNKLDSNIVHLTVRGQPEGV